MKTKVVQQVPSIILIFSKFSGPQRLSDFQTFFLTEVSIFRQDNIFCPDTHFVVLVVVGHSVVEEDSESVLEVRDLGFDGKRLVPKITQTT